MRVEPYHRRAAAAYFAHRMLQERGVPNIETVAKNQNQRLSRKRRSEPAQEFMEGFTDAGPPTPCFAETPQFRRFTNHRFQVACNFAERGAKRENACPMTAMNEGVRKLQNRRLELMHGTASVD